MRLILGAYASAPAGLHRDPGAEREWYRRLREEPLVGGLELGWADGVHPHGVDHLVDLIDAGWSSVVTVMPGVSERLAVDAGYGLASTSASGREKALSDLARVAADVAAVRAANGPDAVHTVQIQSAPGRGASSEAFSDSLERILDWDWEGVRVVVEHCDAWTGPLPQKGFLPLEDERSALERARSRAGTETGITVNWARSVIETRDAENANRHLSELSSAALLSGLMFSGVAPVDTVFGAAWADAHLPATGDGEGLEPASLLTDARIIEAIRHAGGTAYLGAKVSAPKRDDIDLLDRLDPGIATLRAIDRAVSA